MLKHGGCETQEDKIEGLVGRLRELEDIVRNQAQVIENILSEKQKTTAQIHETLFPLDGIVPDGLEIEKGAVRPSLQLGEEIIDIQKQKPGVFVRSDDSDPLVAVVTQLTEKVSEVSAGLQALKSEMTETSTSVFVRWGSSTCPDSSVLVYSGEVGGSYYTFPGAAVNYLCLPLSNVTLSDITVNNFAHLYGGEYETLDGHYQKDPMCAVCRSSRANNVMIPATTVCPSGWTSEYSGWLMAGDPHHSAASEFICVDSKMEERIGSEKDNNGKLLYYTSTVCGSLPCPPYVNGKRVTCVVCSR
ncbi:hypothetical protein C0Q70_08799 [Pomacea canaliculata]|uniref:Uncharacterized protein n=2 Tax=Pomacea canaliculata TaxID=400727 RepID=A0A2T7P806_POMCA|nr:hypothetical protein C0Q70_08799 [Pomacea canaliculata]